MKVRAGPWHRQFLSLGGFPGSRSLGTLLPFHQALFYFFLFIYLFSDWAVLLQ